ncbi:MAG TPA: DNA polymerase III subunit gamma/tau [Candidatus Peribacteraceae bacterium]|nr:DNA polymerase III subunit gamma/tau [Candidatus Peribacteraceae bacterium]
MSLYRQYRPKTFNDVTGQDAVVETLKQAVAQDKIAHAYLFAGTRGTGKTSIARILAKELLTRGITDEVLKKNILQAVDDGSLVDLTEIDAASNRGIDDIRSLLEKIQFTPVAAAAKVYIIDEVHMLTREAFNALLKTLEEPPAYAYFILATTELHKIPATIQSRCQRFLFRQIREEDIVARLRFICDSERIEADDDALFAIAHHAGGSMRDAISLLDQLRSLPHVTIQDVKERIGETGFEYVEQILAALNAQDRNAVIRIVREMESAAVPMETFTRLLLGTVRNQLHAAIQEGQNPGASLQLLDTLMDTIKDLRSAPVPGLALEAALLSLTGITLPSTSAQPVAPASPKPAADTPKKVSPAVRKDSPATEMAAAPAASSDDLSLEKVKQKWADIIDAAEPASAKMSLKNGHVHAIEGQTIVVRFGSAFHRDKASDGTRSVEDALHSVFGKPLKLKCVLDSDLQTSALPAGDDPVNLADAAMEIF